ncbi:murein L,D-transpeptidase catalytic domain-containing protein [Pedobacter sp. MC2016-24]|uniref:murein L,D-transpeptidase catalytic domain-containing protein n=1 Tax=Pedobacter sp. MC2016-24 TaxID=2780090 RepID=UPI00187E1236|nr:murein L,D-transpeptidase catalytic domain family protein [Pedobacter sp. MC2016-24]MBE9601334.1 murein L,D-transpeptidase catalytic domain family protein [Pedobacter sp. MC2016-24]
MKGITRSILFCMFLSFGLQAKATDTNPDLMAAKALQYSKTHKMNTSYCILVDMSIHSGKNRLFVYNFKKKKVIIKGLCAHGSGGGSGPLSPVYSNEIGSNCTSLGKYKLGSRAYSKWGIHVHYKMHGLEKTNNNAFKRIVVLHSYTPVPAFQTYPLPLFGVSSGCPVIANATMRKIDKLLKTGQKNMLLWIYES